MRLACPVLEGDCETAFRAPLHGSGRRQPECRFFTDVSRQRDRAFPKPWLYSAGYAARYPSNPAAITLSPASARLPA